MSGPGRSTLTRLESFGRVLYPADAPAPILAGATRQLVIEWLREIESREALAAARLEPRRKAMLFGPPGCGKTTLAHHLCGRLGMPLLLVEAANLLNAYKHDSARNVAAAFEEASRARAAVFLDEFDSLATRREDSGRSVDQDNAHTVNTLLRRLDAFAWPVIAATNRREVIDPAVWRRFDLHLDIDLPGADERWAIVKMYADPFLVPASAHDFLADALLGAPPSLIRQTVESLKRALVLAPRMAGGLGTAGATLAGIVGSIVPPDMYEVDLWLGRARPDDMPGEGWPWPMEGGA